MDPTNLIGYPIPAILVVLGLVAFFLSFTNIVPPPNAMFGRICGAIVALLGVLLALLIKAPKTEPVVVIQPVYNIPTQVAATAPTAPSAVVTLSSPPQVNTPIPIATATSVAFAEQATGTSVPPTVTTAAPPTPTSTATAVPLPLTATHAPPTATRVVLPTATATNTPEPVVNVIPVWGIDEAGVRVNLGDAGLYKVSYIGDAYSPWPNAQSEGYRGWTVILRIYVNRPVQWGTTEYGLTGPINFDDYLGQGGYYLEFLTK